MLRGSRFSGSFNRFDSQENLIATEQTKPTVRTLYENASAASVGLELGLGTVLGWAIGHWLDGQLGTDPYLMLLFLCLGIAAGFKGVIRVAKQANAAEAESNEQ